MHACLHAQTQGLLVSWSVNTPTSQFFLFLHGRFLFRSPTLDRDSTRWTAAWDTPLYPSCPGQARRCSVCQASTNSCHSYGVPKLPLGGVRCVQPTSPTMSNCRTFVFRNQHCIARCESFKHHVFRHFPTVLEHHTNIPNTTINGQIQN